MGRVKTVYKSSEIPALWIKGEGIYATNPGRTFLCKDNSLYIHRYGSDRPIAKILKSQFTGEMAIVRSRTYYRGIQYRTRSILSEIIEPYKTIDAGWKGDVVKIESPTEFYNENVLEPLCEDVETYLKRFNEPNKEGYYHKSYHYYLRQLIDKWSNAEWFIKFFGLGIKVQCNAMTVEEFENHKLMLVIGGGE